MISDEEVNRLQKFAARHNLDLEIGTTPSISWAALGNDRPATFLVNQEGGSQLYQNQGNWKFADTTAAAGLGNVH